MHKLTKIELLYFVTFVLEVWIHKEQLMKSDHKLESKGMFQV